MAVNDETNGRKILDPPQGDTSIPKEKIQLAVYKVSLASCQEQSRLFERELREIKAIAAYTLGLAADKELALKRIHEIAKEVLMTADDNTDTNILRSRIELHERDEAEAEATIKKLRKELEGAYKGLEAYRALATKWEGQARQQIKCDKSADRFFLSRVLFEAREQLDMWADVVESRTGERDHSLTRLIKEIDTYRRNRGWLEGGYGNE